MSERSGFAGMGISVDLVAVGLSRWADEPDEFWDGTLWVGKSFCFRKRRAILCFYVSLLLELQNVDSVYFAAEVLRTNTDVSVRNGRI